MKLKHGFKAHARRIAAEARIELGSAPQQALDPYALAQLWGLRVIGVEEVDCDTAAEHFTTTAPEAFSGALIPYGAGAVILENRCHDFVRRRSTVAHEMGHWLLEHSLETLLVDGDGCRSREDERELEAAELSGELLIPWEQAKRLAYRGTPVEVVADHYQVSAYIARWRMNMSGGYRMREAVRGKRAV